MSAQLDNLLSRLDGAKPTGAGKWLVKCPAHDDRNASLAIKHTDDDKILIKCWAGCSAESVLAAIGLTFSDLYPPKPAHDFDPTKPKAKPPKFTAREMLRLCIFEASLIGIAFEQLRRGAPLSDTDTARVNQALATLDEIRKEAGNVAG